MKQHEANFALRFRAWLRANPIGYSATFELKDCSNKKSFAYSELKEAQRNWALAISEGKKGALMRQLGGSGEADYTYHFQQPAYIVINFKEGFCLITIQDFLTEEKKSERKSLTHDRAREISRYSV